MFWPELSSGHLTVMIRSSVAMSGAAIHSNIVAAKFDPGWSGLAVEELSSLGRLKRLHKRVAHAGSDSSLI